MTRTDMDIDDDACAAVMRRYGLRAKREAINLVLRMVAVWMVMPPPVMLPGWMYWQEHAMNATCTICVVYWREPRHWRLSPQMGYTSTMPSL